MIPSPRNPIRSPAALMTESSPTGGLDAQTRARPERPGRLARQLLPVQCVAPGHPVAPAVGAAGAVAAALGDQREAHLSERFELAHDAVAAPKPACATRAAAQRV